MTKRELLNALAPFPDDAEVEVSDDQGEWPIGDVEEEDGIVFLVPNDEEEDEETSEADEEEGDAR